MYVMLFLLLQVESETLCAQIGKGVQGIEEEISGFQSASPEECKDLRDILKYITKEPCSEKEYSNGTRDKGRNGKKLDYFMMHRYIYIYIVSDVKP